VTKSNKNCNTHDCDCKMFYSTGPWTVLLHAMPIQLYLGGGRRRLEGSRPPTIVGRAGHCSSMLGRYVLRPVSNLGRPGAVEQIASLGCYSQNYPQTSSVHDLDRLTHGILTEGKAQYSWPPH